MPFQKATALVTVERAGVLEAKVVELSGSSPVVDVNVSRKYAPGVYVSVMAVRGRVGQLPSKAGQIDRGKPAFRMGLKKLNVASASNSLDIEVAADKGADFVFEAGSDVAFTATVKTPNGQPVQDGELAVAVVDEAILALSANSTWDILSKMLEEKPLTVNTYTGNTYLIGARHFGQKAIEHGGAGAAREAVAGRGGSMNSRDNFVPLVAFLPRVTVKNGKAKFNFKANDSLSTFKVVAVGQKDLDRFGMGSTTYRTNKDVILNSGLTKSIRTDDVFKAEFQVRNTTDKEEFMTVGGTVTYTMADGSTKTQPLGEKTIEVAPADATSFSFDDMQLIEGATSAKYNVWAKNSSGKQDAFNAYQRISESVGPTVRSLDFGAVGTEAGDFSKVKVGLAETAVPGVGGVYVTLSPNPLGDMQNVANAMAEYPYLKSFGYKAAEAVVGDNEEAWDALMAEAPAYFANNNLLKPYAKVNYGSSDLTVFVLKMASAKGWKIPSESEAKMIAGLKNYAVSGFETDTAHVNPERTLRERVSALDAIASSAAYANIAQGRSMMLPQAALDLVPADLSPATSDKIPTVTLFKWYNLIVHAGDRMANAGNVKEQLLAVLANRLVANGREVEVREGTNARGNSSYYESKSQQAIASVAYLQNPELKAALPQAKAEGLMVGLLNEQSNTGVWFGYRANAWGAIATETYKSEPGGKVTGTTYVSFGAANANNTWAEMNGDNEARFAMTWEEAQAVSGDVEVTHDGAGKPWAFVKTVAAVPVLENNFNGIVLDKKVEAVRQVTPGQWTRTDIAKVTLTINPDTDLQDVAVYDPIPAGARILSQSVGWYGYYSEARADAYVASLPRVSRDGGMTVTYLIEFTSLGNFTVPGTRVEAVFAPEQFGEWANKNVSVTDL